MNISEDLIKKYIELKNRENEISGEMQKIKENKFNELYSKYDNDTLNELFLLRRKINKYSGMLFKIVVGIVCLLPTLIVLFLTRKNASIDSGCIKMVILFGILGIATIVSAIVSYQDYKTIKLYNKLKNEQDKF